MNLFLKEQVLYRAKRQKIAAVPDSPAIPDESGEDQQTEIHSRNQNVGLSTVQIYVAAVVDLWRQQQEKGVNANDNPRLGAVSKLIDVMRKDVQKAKRLAYADRGAGM